MSTDYPLQILSEVLASAKYKDFKDMTYEAIDWSKVGPKERELHRNDKTPFPTKEVTRRPVNSEIEVCGMFTQAFSSTACGHGGIGGSAITGAYVICLRNEYVGEALVYTAGRLLRKYDLTNHESSDKFYKIVREMYVSER